MVKRWRIYLEDGKTLHSTHSHKVSRRRGGGGVAVLFINIVASFR